MEEPNLTASAILSFTEKLEDESSKFYEKLARMSTEDKETFLIFSKDSQKNKVLVVRTYQETISDALEACFSFKGLNLDDFAVETKLQDDDGYSVALKTALNLEKTASAFYSKVAELSESLLATIPSAFRKVAKNRKRRIIKLESLINE